MARFGAAAFKAPGLGFFFSEPLGAVAEGGDAPVKLSSGVQHGRHSARRSFVLNEARKLASVLRDASCAKAAERNAYSELLTTRINQYSTIL